MKNKSQHSHDCIVCKKPWSHTNKKCTLAKEANCEAHCKSMGAKRRRANDPGTDRKLPAQPPIVIPKPKPSTPEEMSARAIAMVVTFSGIGNRRKVSNSQIEIKADKEWIAVSKKLIDAEELEAIQSLDGEARRYIESRALPMILKKGVYLMPVAFVEEANTRLAEYASQRTALVEKLVAAYAGLVKEARTRLRDLFDDADYPTVDEIKAAFKLTWRYIAFDTPTALKKIDPELYARECRKTEAAWEETREAGMQLLRENFSELVKHLTDKLTLDGKGERKVFRDSAVSNLKEFLDTFDPRNGVLNDLQLKALADRAKALVAGVDPDTLRTSDSMRDFVRSEFAKIENILDPMLVQKPKRSISFDEV